MITEFMMVGGLLFWGFLFLISLTLIACVESEQSWGWGLFLLVVVGAVLMLFSDAWVWVKENPLLVVGLIVGYMLVGVAWTIPRWIIFLRRVRTKLKQARVRFCDKNGLDCGPGERLPQEHWKAWSDEVCWRFVRYGISFDADKGELNPPSFSVNRDMIIVWAQLWPWSVFWTIFREIVMEFIETVVDWWGQLYGRLSEWFFKDI